MSYRPICDVWLLARPKVKYYGAYPAGFLSRARHLLGVGFADPVLHVCGGMVRDYPLAGFGPCDRTVDADPQLAPDYVLDVTRDPLPTIDGVHGWPAILADPPYTEADHAAYAVSRPRAVQPDLGDPAPRSCPAVPLPNPNALLKACIEAVRPGGRVGMLHYVIPRQPRNARFIACVGVVVGFGNRGRFYSVFEREVRP